MAFDLISKKQTAANYALGASPAAGSNIGAVANFDDKDSFFRKLPFLFAVVGAFAAGNMLGKQPAVHPYTLRVMAAGNSRNRKKHT